MSMISVSYLELDRLYLAPTSGWEAWDPAKMSFDPFQARLDFLGLLRKLNASLPSIQKVVAFAVRYGSRCGEDLWECITEECSKVSLIPL